MTQITQAPISERWDVLLADTIKENPRSAGGCLIVTVVLVAGAIIGSAIVAATTPSIYLTFMLCMCGVQPIFYASPFAIILAFKVRAHAEENIFRYLAKNNSSDCVKNKSDLILMLQASRDHNNAFNHPAKIEFLYKMHKKHPIAFAKISRIEDVEMHISRLCAQNNRITTLWFQAHGAPTSMALDENTLLTTQKLSCLADSFRKIDPNAQIVLESCCTGEKPSEGGFNIAETIAYLAQGRTVIAPCTVVNKLRVEKGSIKLYHNAKEVTRTFRYSPGL